MELAFIRCDKDAEVIGENRLLGDAHSSPEGWCTVTSATSFQMIRQRVKHTWENSNNC